MSPPPRDDDRRPLRPQVGDVEVPIRQAADGRSLFGLFPVEDEPRVLASLLEELRRESAGMELILDEYSHSVPDSTRRERAAALVSEIQAQSDSVDLRRVIELLYFGGHQRLLRRYHIRFPAYNILDEFFTGAAAPSGPRAPARPVVHGRNWSLLGRRIGFPIGVPASVLTSNAEWIHYFARNGFNVLTYRTVRSRFHPAFPAPNWVFVPSLRDPLPVTVDRTLQVQADPSDWVVPGDPEVSTSNSFGVPSYSVEEWQSDLREALHVIHHDQLLIVSVLGDIYPDTELRGRTRAQALADDFALTARLAEEAGAEIIELNLSCPNSVDPDGTVRTPLCVDTETTALVVNSVRAELRPQTRLVIKLAYLSYDSIVELLSRVGQVIDAVSGINTLQSRVVRRDGRQTFPGREKAGVSGIAVRRHAEQFVADMALARLRGGFRFDIIGMGGVTDPQSMESLYRLGANVVQSASGVFANPFLAQDCVSLLGERLPAAPPLPTSESPLVVSLREALLETLRQRGPLTRAALAVSVSAPLGQTLGVIDQLLRTGLVQTRDDRMELPPMHLAS